jgi:hypothetical protein
MLGFLLYILLRKDNTLGMTMFRSAPQFFRHSALCISSPSLLSPYAQVWLQPPSRKCNALLCSVPLFCDELFHIEKKSQPLVKKRISGHARQAIGKEHSELSDKTRALPAEISPKSKNIKPKANKKSSIHQSHQ